MMDTDLLRLAMMQAQGNVEEFIEQLSRGGLRSGVLAAAFNDLKALEEIVQRAVDVAKPVVMVPHPFKVGDIVRYGPSPTELMRVKDVQHLSNGDVQYYGPHILEGNAAALHRFCRPASPADLTLWEERKG